MFIPFFNRKNYIELNVYTPFKELVGYNILRTISASKVSKEDPSNLASCYGYIKGLKKSVSLLNPCDFSVDCTEQDIHYKFPSFTENRGAIDTEVHKTPHALGKDIIVTKISYPFLLETKEPVPYVLASHIFNDSSMNIPTGIATCRPTQELNIFNYVRIGQSYSVPAFKPLASLFFLSEKDVHLNFIWDEQKYTSLKYASFRFFERADYLKRERLDDDQAR